MAERKESLILEVEIDRSGAETELDKVEKSLLAAKRQQQELNKAFKEGKITEDQYIKSNRELQNQIKRENDQKKVLNNLLETESNSRNAMRQRVSQLTREYNNLNTKTKEGAARYKQLEVELKSLNEELNKGSKAAGNFKDNIGNYKSALDGVHPALGRVGEGLEAGTSGFKAMTLQALRFIATPIGAVLAALVAVFGLLKTAITTNNEVFDKFENITNAIGQVITIVTNRIGKLGEALIALASGNFSEAIDLTGQAFGGLADEIGRAVVEGQALLDMSRDLEDAQRQLRIEQAKQENVIKALVVSSRNRNLTLDEQEAKLREALRLEQGLVAERERLAQQELEIAVRRIANDEEIQKASEETFQQFAERLIKNGQLGDDQVDGLIEQIEKLESARGSSLAFQEKVENDLAAIQERRAAALEKQNAALAEQAALNRANERLANRTNAEVDDPLTGAFEDRLNNELDAQLRFNKRIADAQQEAAYEAIRIKRREAEARIELERRVADSQINISTGLLAVGASMFEQQSAEYKTFATAQTLISTYAAAQKAFEAAFTPPTVASPGLAAGYVALAVAQGLANLAKIHGVQFAEGGWTGPGAKYDVAGVVHADEYVVPKVVNNSPAARPHLAALENMRLRGYADGGYVTRASTAPINQQVDIMNMIKSMPAPVVSVKEITNNQKRVRVKEQLSSR